MLLAIATALILAPATGGASTTPAHPVLHRTPAPQHVHLAPRPVLHRGL